MPNLANGAPDRLLGYSIRIDEQIADVGTNTFPILFGRLDRAHTVVVSSLRVTIDDVSTPGVVRFYFRRRLAGGVRNDESLKCIRAAAS